MRRWRSESVSSVSMPIAADSDLRLLVQAWRALPDTIKAGIVAMVKVARSELRGST